MDRFAKFLGYIRTLRQYSRHAKGRHDMLDYGRASLGMLLTMAALWWLLSFGY